MSLNWEVRVLLDSEYPDIAKKANKIIAKRSQAVQRHQKLVEPIVSQIASLTQDHRTRLDGLERTRQLAIIDHQKNLDGVDSRIRALRQTGMPLDRTIPEMDEQFTRREQLEKNHQEHLSQIDELGSRLQAEHQSSLAPLQSQLSQRTDDYAREIGPLNEKLRWQERRKLGCDKVFRQHNYTGELPDMPEFSYPSTTRVPRIAKVNPGSAFLEAMLEPCPRCQEELVHRTWESPRFPEPVCMNCRDELESVER